MLQSCPDIHHQVHMQELPVEHSSPEAAQVATGGQLYRAEWHWVGYKVAAVSKETESVCKRLLHVCMHMPICAWSAQQQSPFSKPLPAANVAYEADSSPRPTGPAAQANIKPQACWCLCSTPCLQWPAAALSVARATSPPLLLHCVLTAPLFPSTRPHTRTCSRLRRSTLATSTPGRLRKALLMPLSLANTNRGPLRST